MTQSDVRPVPMQTTRQQIRKLLIMMSAASAVIIAVLALVLISVSHQASDVLACATTAADFNQEFKANLDLEMYNHVIRPRSADSV